MRIASAFSILTVYWIALSSAPIVASTEQADPRSSPVSFNRVIRPTLSKNCYLCHGPDEAHRKAKLRLDVPGKADLGKILERITSADPQKMMPPPSTGKKLTRIQVEEIERWIATGAPYEEHWSFVAPRRLELSSQVHPIDYFIDQRLEQDGLARSPRADPYTRIRRVFLDLIGLPPTTEQTDAFVADPSLENYEDVVESLLESPQYGERWARRWLDLARYADTNGYEKDRDRSIWPYRDWVIRAINADMPFDQFTIEQLAGDMLPNPTVDQMTATGFHRNTMLNEEGGIDPLEFRYHAMTDRVATTGITWLGLTTGCAQCHTHKYDPITHHNYFGMMAYLNNTVEPDYFISTEDSRTREAENLLEADRLMAELANHWPIPRQGETQEVIQPSLEEAFDEWLSTERENTVDWMTWIPIAMSANTPYLTHEDEGVIFASGDTSKHDIYSFEFPPIQQTITSIRLEALEDDRLPGRGPGMTYYEGQKGDFYLTEFEVEDDAGARLEIADASETYAKNGFGTSPVSAKLAIDGDIQSGWSVADFTGSRHVAVFNFKEPIPAGARIKIRMHFGRHFASSLGKFRLSTTSIDRPIKASLLTNKEALSILSDNAYSNMAIRNAFFMQSEKLADHVSRIRNLRRHESNIQTLVMRERPPAHTRETHRHLRGEYTQPTELVTPHLPEVLLFEGKVPPSNRLEFARWLVARDNPLTARVVANRHWGSFFGSAIVNTPDDFGMQGEVPSHPSLLDYLAVELMEQNWSIKALHRLIVTSETYQQSSHISGPRDEAEGTRLLQRFPRQRLEAEIIRDSSLEAAGLLNKTMFGPPVRPPQPDSAEAANYAKSRWVPSQGPDRYRRSLYTYQKRTAPFSMFTTFDATSGEACVAKRDVSNTPLQSLTLMNDPMFIEIAEAYGKRMEVSNGVESTKIEKGFRWLLTRPPSLDELALLNSFHEEHKSWTALARVMLCLDESITKN